MQCAGIGDGYISTAITLAVGGQWYHLILASEK
jgi:hypothetical protein